MHDGALKWWCGSGLGRLGKLGLGKAEWEGLGETP